MVNTFVELFFLERKSELMKRHTFYSMKIISIFTFKDLLFNKSMYRFKFLMGRYLNISDPIPLKMS